MSTAEGKQAEPIALFDLDGTLADFESAMDAQMKALAAPGEQAVHDRDTEPPHIKARRRLVKQQPGFWRGLAELELGFRLLDLCVALDYSITILSKAPDEKSGFTAWSEKAEWCNTHLRPRYPDTEISISLVQDKGHHYGKVLVDDWPAYVTRWLEWRPRGLVVMPALHYNAGFTHDNVIRFDGRNVDQVQEALAAQRRTAG